MATTTEAMEAILTGNGDDAFVPDGWDENTDIFSAEFNDGNPLAGQQDSDYLRGLEKVESGEGDASTNGDDGTASNDPTEDGEAESDGHQAEADTRSRVLRIKVNHEEMDVDVGSMSDEDMIAVLQKSRAFDAIQESKAREKYKAFYQEQIDAGMTEEVAKMTATNKFGKEYDLMEEAAEKPSQAPAPITNGNRDYTAEVRELMKRYPDFTEMPDEVAEAAANGESLIDAYGAWRDKTSRKAAAESKKETATLKRENTILKQNMARQAQAPVRGITGGGKTESAKDDDFIKGFDSDPW